MIPNIRAVAIDDEKDHLDAIHEAAISANISCRKVHFPQGLNEALVNELKGQPIRLVICDLHLSSGAALGPKEQIFGNVAGVLMGLGLSPWNPYVMVLWTQYPEEADELRLHLEKRLPNENFPSALIALSKADYGIPGKPTEAQKEALWKGLKEKMKTSRGLNVLLQWEAEIQRAANQVACNLMETARLSTDGNPKKIAINDELDGLLSRIARAATSDGFAQEHPRNAVAEGLFPLVSDQYQHLESTLNEKTIWADGLQQAINKSTQDSLSKEGAAALNSALHIARDVSVARPERGSVFECTEQEALVRFGTAKAVFGDVFGTKGKWPIDARLRYIQLEGACDAAQRKKGVVPFVLAAEVDATLALKEKGEGKGKRPVSVEETPIFLSGIEGQAPRKILVNVRYFFTMERSAVNDMKPVYRLRESLVAKLAFTWANHTIRPGIVSFDHDDTSENPDSSVEAASTASTDISVK